jgi:hypothetical protein
MAWTNRLMNPKLMKKLGKADPVRVLSRWWEARTLWGGIVYSSRVLARLVVANCSWGGTSIWPWPNARRLEGLADEQQGKPQSRLTLTPNASLGLSTSKRRISASLKPRRRNTGSSASKMAVKG